MSFEFCHDNDNYSSIQILYNIIQNKTKNTYYYAMVITSTL